MTINLDGSTFTLDGVQLPDGVVYVERDDLGHPIAYSLNHIGVTEMQKSPHERRSMLMGSGLGMAFALAALGAAQLAPPIAGELPPLRVRKPKDTLGSLLYGFNGKPAISEKRQREKSMRTNCTGKQMRKQIKKHRAQLRETEA
jgi:hypothetical protein